MFQGDSAQSFGCCTHNMVVTRSSLHRSYCMIGLCLLMAGDESRMAGGESRMAGGEPRMTGDCCRPEGSIHRCVRTHSHLYSYIYGVVALSDNIQSSFSSITISTARITIPSLVITEEPLDGLQGSMLRYGRGEHCA